ncbi:hypothetical protein FOB58_000613 [Candida parapsilosis]|uniref:Uncharacterized protein n=2 Tax=Candida parapsilosis TaxID=5480 RepID=G8BD14_CANPC|nr:uncharacterized protein CPAR2_208020 [Candida parapsilosis]KAF6054691.1 hypothetical protein FOB58_000613 [Candida parapsilosis]KAF6056283.1 hypothetical protein FOB59_000795 [Candida parapsilosis]KAF6059216.1 hypothetical protein FOB60_000798 [Candida parapsilosis]KAF6067973.1 hypothetical protein FOB61_000798 [Candida parapsilosis]KAI5905491.1 hypothetical protein K4G60_g4751 [Candida parapsilosis]
MPAASSAITPMRALIAGGVCYGLWSIYMAKNYFQNSSMRKIYVTSDPEFAKVHPMRHPQYEGNLNKE